MRARVAIGVGVNVLLSWGVLPLLLTSTRAATRGDFAEVAMWQTVGMVAWPLAILGGVLSLVFQQATTKLWPLLFVLVYPTMLFLFVYLLRSKRQAYWAVIALHLLITASFAAVWYRVLNGYDFMVG
jgi:hypothetical protein